MVWRLLETAHRWGWMVMKVFVQSIPLRMLSPRATEGNSGCLGQCLYIKRSSGVQDDQVLHRLVIIRLEFSVWQGFSPDRQLQSLESLQNEPIVCTPGQDVKFMRKSKEGRSRSAGTGALREAEIHSFHPTYIDQRTVPLPTRNTSRTARQYLVTATPAVYTATLNKAKKGEVSVWVKTTTKLHLLQCIPRDTHWLWKSDTCTICL